METAEPSDPTIETLLSELGQAIDASDDHKIVQLASKILAKNPREEVALKAKAFAEFHLGQRETFETTIDEAISVAEQPQELQVFKSLAFGSFEEYGDALSAAEEAIEADSKNDEAWEAKAAALLSVGRASEALEAAEKAVALSPERPSAHQGILMWALLSDEKYEQGLAVADQLIEAGAKGSEPFRARAAALNRLERHEEALLAAERAAEEEPDSLHALGLFASLVTLSGDYEKGLKAYEDWVALEPSDSDGWVGLGLVRSFRGEWEVSISAFQRAIDLDPNLVEPRAWMAKALTQIGEAKRALTILTEVSLLEPDHEDIWVGKASAERTLGLNEASIGSALKGLEVGKFESSLAWLELARSYSAAGRHSNAWRAFANAVELDRDLFDAALGLAVESIQCHSESRALEELREAEERLGSDALIEYNRGVAHYKLGREDVALDAWRRAQRLDPEFAAAEVLVEALSGKVRAGSWADHWFAPSASRWRRFVGVILIALLLLFAVVPFLEPSLIPGLETGRLNFEAFIPAIIFALLIALPAIRGLAVGGVSVEVDPIGSSQRPSVVDPTQILPIFASEELDVMLLTKR